MAFLAAGVSPRPHPDITHASMRFTASWGAVPSQSLHRSKRFISNSFSDKKQSKPLETSEFRKLALAESFDNLPSVMKPIPSENFTKASVSGPPYGKPHSENQPSRHDKQTPAKRFIGLESRQASDVYLPYRDSQPDAPPVRERDAPPEGRALPAKDLISRLMAQRYQAAPPREVAVPPQLVPASPAPEQESIGRADDVSLVSLKYLLKLLAEKVAHQEKSHTDNVEE